MTYLEQRRNYIEAGRPLKQKKSYQIKKVSDRRAAKIKEQQQSGTDSEMDLFFKSMRKSMTGKCLFCGADTMKKDNDKFHFSLAHLLPKSSFKSIATHPSNIIELCFYNNSCHTNFDSGKITWEFIRDSKEWDVIKEQLFEILPLVAPEEQKHKLYSKLVDLIYHP